MQSSKAELSRTARDKFGLFFHDLLFEVSLHYHKHLPQFH